MYLIVQGISKNYLYLIIINTLTINVAFYSVALLVETLHYKSEGRVISPRWSHWDFLIDLFFPPAILSWDRLSLFNRSEYKVSLLWGKGDRYNGLTTVPTYVTIV